MRLLLDTHTFIWFVIDSPRLSVTVRGLIEDENNEKFLSIASVWEVAIKQSMGKLNFGLPLKELIESQLRLNSIELLNITLDHLAVVVTLPFHHKDPFDRLLIAQTIVEEIPILSTDSTFDAYPIKRIW